MQPSNRGVLCGDGLIKKRCEAMDLFASNGADKPKQNKPRPWYSTSAGLLMILILLVVTITLIFSIIQLYNSQTLPR
jgi:hypothetical protein